MLVKLTVEQVKKEWEFLVSLLSKGLPDHIIASGDGFANILRAIMLDTAHIWLYADKGEFYAGCLTVFNYDPIVGSKHLLIYSIASVKQLTIQHFKDGITTLMKHAHDTKCESIQAYTTNPAIARLVERAGGKADNIFLEFHYNEVAL